MLRVVLSRSGVCLILCILLTGVFASQLNSVTTRTVSVESSTNTTTPIVRPRTQFIKTAPAIILLIAACVLAVIVSCMAVMLCIKRAFMKQEPRFFMFWCFVITAIFTTAVTYLCASQNQFVYKRTVTDVVYTPFIANNVLTWILVLFLVAQFCCVAVAVILALLAVGSIGFFVQAVASFADDGVQWGIYVLGEMPLVTIPVILWLSMRRKKKRTDKIDYLSLFIVIATMCALRTVYTVTDLAGHSFGGRYHGLGISDEVALQILQNAALILFMAVLSFFTLSPSGERAARDALRRTQTTLSAEFAPDFQINPHSVTLLSAQDTHGA